MGYLFLPNSIPFYDVGDTDDDYRHILKETRKRKKEGEGKEGSEKINGKKTRGKKKSGEE